MKILGFAAAATAVVAAGCCCKNSCTGNDPVGNWGLKLPYDTMYAGSAIFSRGDDGKASALVLWRWASPVETKNVKIEGDKFSFQNGGIKVAGTVSGDVLSAEAFDKKGKKIGDVSGWRNPPIDSKVSTKDAKLGEPIDLLADGLNGWVLMNKDAKNGWKFKDGVLSNCLGLKPNGKWAGGGSNLMTKRADFFDFNLEYDVRVPKSSNSGVYLRGRYEIQVLDSFGMKANKHNMGALYGRITPSAAVEKPAGEWQHVSVTLYKRHLTVVLNGKTIIDNAPVEGVTGGAIDANEFVPGPIYLQGDHSDADFRNMILRKAE